MTLLLLLQNDIGGKKTKGLLCNMVEPIIGCVKCKV